MFFSRFLNVRTLAKAKIFAAPISLLLVVSAGAYGQMPFSGGSHVEAGSAGQGSKVNPSAFASSAQGIVGIMLQDVNKNYYKVPGKYTNAGAYVAYVMSGTPAELAGIKNGDIILELDNNLISGIGSFESVFPQVAGDNSLNVKIYRNGKEILKKVNLPATGVSRNSHVSTGSVATNRSRGPEQIISSMMPKQARHLGHQGTAGASQYKTSQTPYSQNYPGMFIEDMLNKSPIRFFSGNKRIDLNNNRSGYGAGAAGSNYAAVPPPVKAAPKTLSSQVNRRLEVALSALSLKDELALTPSQVKTLKSISYSFRITNIQNRAGMEVAKLQLDQALSSDEINEDEVKGMLEKVAELRIKQTLAVIKMIKEGESTLSKKQAKKLKALLGL